MELSPEAYRIIVKHTLHRTDVLSLCRVSRGFQRVAERALYNTLFMYDIPISMALCNTLASNSRVGALVDALTISPSTATDASRAVSGMESPASGSSGRTTPVGDEEDDGLPPRPDDRATQSSGASVEDAASPASDKASLNQPDNGIPSEFWPLVAQALRNLPRLCHLNVYLTGILDSSLSWVLQGCIFQLRAFHCDFDWDPQLVEFLHSQNTLADLYITDFNEDNADTQNTLIESTSLEHDSHSHSPPPPSEPPVSPNETQRFTSASSLMTRSPHSLVFVRPIMQLSPQALPKLSTLECTFSEAAVALAPGRPISRLKTCFSKNDREGKRAELAILLAKVATSKRFLKSLDIADSYYSEDFSLEIVGAVTRIRKLSQELRYLGTLVLPIGGAERLRFYGLLMKFPKLKCLEVDVTDWEPRPSSLASFRALSGEIRLYCPTLTRVIFVSDFDRTVIRFLKGVAQMEDDATPELLWREVS